MTPSELAKVREALVEPDECSSCDGNGTLTTPESAYPCGICGGDGMGRVRIKALAIIDREAGRKTRTVYVVEAMLGGQWVCIERTPDRERVEKYRVSFGAATRILEVTESWEEPKA